MNTARRVFDYCMEPAAGTRTAYENRRDYAGHLRLVVDNTNPLPEPVFELPAWFDHLGKAMWYSAAGLVIINIVNQIVLW